MTHIKTIEINEENVINFAASLGISATSIDIIMEMVEDKIQTILEASTVKLLAYAKIMFLLFFGTARDLWSLILHAIIGVPRGPYKPHSNKPVLHCPICGRPGRPNGTTRVGTHQYICPYHKKTFTERSSAEYRLFRRILLLKAYQLLKSGLSIRLISILLGISRAELSEAFSKLDVSRIIRNMRALVVATIKGILATEEYALLVLDTTFVGSSAVILVTVAGDAVSMFVAEAEKKKYIAASIAFLKKKLSAEEARRLVFLSDGSIHIFKAIRQLFPHSVHIRQFHSKKHIGLVHTHFEYNEKRYTLVTRWDHLVPEDERMHNVRGLLEGEKLLREGEVILYEGNLARPPTDLSEKDVERKIGACVMVAEMFISKLDEILKSDYAKYKSQKGGKFTSRVTRMLNTFRKDKTFLKGLGPVCRVVNAAVISGFERLLQQDMNEIDARYISYIYTSFRQMALCEPTESEKIRFKELKTRILENFRMRLVEAGLLQVAENDEKEVSTGSRVKKIFRGMLEELEGEAKEVYNQGIKVLSSFFAGKYITSNPVEGYFGRVKLLVEQHRNAVRSPRYIYIAFWRSSVSFTNRVRMISELMEDYPLDNVFRDETEDIDSAMYEEGAIPRYHNVDRRVLEKGKRYRVLYENRKGEVKWHNILVLKVYRRRKVMRKTWYLVMYVDTGEVRKLRGDRIRKAEEII